MLEKEGVVFDSDGKINIDCFIDVSSAVAVTATSVSSTTAQGSNKKRKVDDNTSKKYSTATTTQTQSTATPTISKGIPKQEIPTLLQKRKEGKTC